ncbi:hypothetical protein ILYODFUR_005084 [Ilyodon furcidens]|uniref:Uncharacterized protein n=1 Tax=Ilyodon furcidens TaxID=33524 RepID=A0ABV0SUB0_9TELE
MRRRVEVSWPLQQPRLIMQGSYWPASAERYRHYCFEKNASVFSVPTPVLQENYSSFSSTLFGAVCVRRCTNETLHVD